MNRLTIRNSDGTVSQPFDLKWAEALEKLAAYEDTGITPEEMNELLYKSYGALHQTLGKWMKAEAEGRLVVLPCKVGDTVYRVWKTEGRKPEITEHTMESLEYIVKWIEKFGKTVFLTREEAEAALAKEATP